MAALNQTRLINSARTPPSPHQHSPPLPSLPPSNPPPPPLFTLALESSSPRKSFVKGGRRGGLVAAAGGGRGAGRGGGVGSEVGVELGVVVMDSSPWQLTNVYKALWNFLISAGLLEPRRAALVRIKHWVSSECLAGAGAPAAIFICAALRHTTLYILGGVGVVERIGKLFSTPPPPPLFFSCPLPYSRSFAPPSISGI